MTRPFADLVFHVLAHVRGSAHLPASLFDEHYVKFAAQLLGPADNRELAKDCAVLERLLTSHERLSRVQWLAWLFDTMEQAARWEHLELCELSAEDVASPYALLELTAQESTANELLRCAVALERPHYENLPHFSSTSHKLTDKLRELERVAPLREFEVRCLRALCGRGRVSGRLIWVGVPGVELGPTVEHAAFQAAHEATVSEVLDVSRELSLDVHERDVEAVALVMLATRAREQGFVTQHTNWLRSLRLPAALASQAVLEVSCLATDLQVIARQMCERQL